MPEPWDYADFKGTRKCAAGPVDGIIEIPANSFKNENNFY